MRKTNFKRSTVFQIALKGGDNRNVAFVMLKRTFSKYWLIKVSMTCMYIKPEVKKNDTTEITTATNEPCIGWLDENCYLMRKELHFW